ncbi:E3 ubiquitin-protein ligase TRIM35-like [Chanodichthys erythropterus]|uniref:E3 ubiquitin-protein ligase TRIM35-like n=1 Tax=Chanodichthys erythropterus TaxID=933992 RepID=UPI00351F59DB
MASQSFAEEDFSCPVCCDIYINPVLLSCSHSVCSFCIQRYWENKTSKECPVCRTTSSNDHPPLNLALKNLCESFLQEKRSSSEDETVCSFHKEKLKLFCLDDQQLVCLVCRDSRKHSNHRFCPVDEAAMDNKEILKSSLERLQEELRISVNHEENLCKTADDIKFQAHLTETKIKEEFEELHQFLRNEEAFRITALREEEEQRNQMMEEKMEETTKQISSITSIIQDIEKQMKAEDVSFLQDIEATLQRAQYSLPDPDLSPSVTITFTDHLTNLKLNVLQKMQDNAGETSEFSINRSNFLIDEVKNNEYKHFQSTGGNMFGGQQSKKGPLQEVKEMKPQAKLYFKGFRQKVKEMEPQPKLYFKDFRQEVKEMEPQAKLYFKGFRQKVKEMEPQPKLYFKDFRQEVKEMKPQPKLYFKDFRQEVKEMEPQPKLYFKDFRQEVKEMEPQPKLYFKDFRQEVKEMEPQPKLYFKDFRQEVKEMKPQPKLSFKDFRQEVKEMKPQPKVSFEDFRQEVKEMEPQAKLSFKDLKK